MELGFRATYCHFMRGISIADIAMLTDNTETEITEQIAEFCKKQCPVVFQYLVAEGKDILSAIKENKDNISVFIPSVNHHQQELPIGDTEQLSLPATE